MGKSSNVASTRATSRPMAVDGSVSSQPGPMAKHAINKSASIMTEDDVSKTRAVVADISGTKSTASEKRAEKCKEKCPANIKECCRNAIAGIYYAVSTILINCKYNYKCHLGVYIYMLQKVHETYSLFIMDNLDSKQARNV